ncbi:hypothetical protein ARMSODRAFT_4233 [Armillaria solidipes]|uniref:Uncharacterized protein n=1 Tax=Armillaria solidipes TaxID=1076256 RepID=A0A2H3C3P8_9AGAR|nr:hypothetical protein ARMSODRAFT_4233 [Armillaria solidipes]
MSKTPTALKDLAVGDIIWTPVIVDLQDFGSPASQSTMAKMIRKGVPVPRLCIVLATGETSVQVTYLATFGDSVTLPSHLDKNMFYPFSPSNTSGGPYEPLPMLDDGSRSPWASLRAKYTITENPVSKTELKVPTSSAALILASMKT